MSDAFSRHLAPWSGKPEGNFLDVAALPSEANRLRRDILDTLFQTGGGHYGGALSVIDILLTMYRRILRANPALPRDAGRDRCILSKGHAAIALYVVLAKLGYFDLSLSSYATFSSVFEGHPDMTTIPGVDFSTGSLGQGLSVGIGMALGLRSSGQRVWVILGDGECQEGQVWEAALFGAQCGVSNLCAIVDCNGHQEWGWRPTAENPDMQPVPDMARKWAAFGWRVLHCDGHIYSELEAAMIEAIHNGGCPCVILARTRKGNGVSLIERDPHRFHCATVSEAEHREIMNELEVPR